MRPFLVLEDLERATPRKVFSLWGTEWLATSRAWLAPVLYGGMGVTMAWLAGARTIAGLVGVGLINAALLYLSNTLHTLGHIVAGSLVGTRMDANLLTATRDVNVYRGAKRNVSPRTRAVRSLGGPVANLLVGGPCLLVGQSSAEWLAMAGVINVAVGLWTLMPVPTLDGWIVWGSLIRWMRRSNP